MTHLENYRALIARIDLLLSQTTAKFASHIACRPGCDACCRHLTVSAVEAAAITCAFKELDPAAALLIRHQAAAAGVSSPCPLLHEGRCLIYHARPIICRTHGLPILIRQEAGTRVDFCPENFRGLTSIPGSAVLDLERLNATLTAINALYLETFPGPERLELSQALLM